MESGAAGKLGCGRFCHRSVPQCYLFRRHL
jgi:hypothetical protein